MKSTCKLQCQKSLTKDEQPVNSAVEELKKQPSLHTDMCHQQKDCLTTNYPISKCNFGEAQEHFKKNSNLNKPSLLDVRAFRTFVM